MPESEGVNIPVQAGYGSLIRIWEWLFLGWIAAIPVMIWFNVRFAGRYTLPFADFLFVGAAAVWLACLLCGASRLRWSGWYFSLLAYSGALILSTIASQNIRHSAPKLAGDLYLIGAALMTFNYVSTWTSLRRALLAWIAGVALTILGCAAGLALFVGGKTTIRQNPFLFHFGTLPQGHYPRLRAMFLDANMMCSYVVAGVMVIVAARRAGWISRRVFIVLLSGGIAAAISSLSPVLGGLFLVLALWRAHTDARGTRVMVTAGILVALLFLAASMVSPATLVKTSLVETILHPEPSSRLLTWADAWRTFLAHPWHGSGTESEAAHVQYLSASGYLQSLTSAHNTWLSILAHQGLPGFAAFSWVVFYLVRRFRLSGPIVDRDAGVRVSLELAMIGGLLYASLLGSFENTRHVWALMGIVAAVQEFPSSPTALRAD